VTEQVTVSCEDSVTAFFTTKGREVDDVYSSVYQKKEEGDGVSLEWRWAGSVFLLGWFGGLPR
jgi:hypothetical protein